MNHLFCFGYGYSASFLAGILDKKFWQISGTTRDEDNIISLDKQNIQAYIFDGKQKIELFKELKDITHILISVPPNHEEGDLVLQHHLDDIKNLPDLKWIGYLSTTGVYGDHQGAWVDEETKTNPFNNRSKAREKSESDWLNTNLPVHIFRLSGIYGPGRSAFDSLKNKTARRIKKEGQLFSRIHVEDIANILLKSIEKPNPGNIYNLSDDMPASQPDIIEFAAGLMDVEPPELIEFEKAELSEMAKSFYKCNRKVSNKKIKQELDIILKYPTYREGLGSIFKKIDFSVS